jgi:cyclic pyranopterin monophosphate synthase
VSRDPVRMVDISEKETVPRRATAVGRLRLKDSTMRAIEEGKVVKGDPLVVAEVAAIQAVKKTSELMPLCHPVPVDSVDTRFTLGQGYVEATCTVTASYRTGVEMEALTGVAVALLNVWDMVKYLEKDDEGQYPDTAITEIRVKEKWKGR